jgi:hypothetical protein
MEAEISGGLVQPSHSRTGAVTGMIGPADVHAPHSLAGGGRRGEDR